MKPIKILRGLLSVFMFLAGLGLGRTQSNIPDIISDYRLNQFSGSPVLLGDVSDPNYTAIAGGTAAFRDKQADLLVSLFIDPDDNACYDGFRKVKADLEVQYRTVNTFGSPSAVITENITLEVYKYPGLESEDRERAYKVYKNAYWSQVRVTGINAEDENGAVVPVNMIPDDVKAELQLQRTRYYHLDPGQLSTTFNSLGSVYTDAFRDQHNVFVTEWAPVYWASEYEVEWTYVDNFSGGGLGTEIAMNALPLQFKNNASRVRVPATQTRYYIPLVYSRGYVCVRVRPLTKGGPGLDKDLFGNWSFDPSGSGTFMVSALPAQCRYKLSLYNGALINNLNAQYGISFAEDGRILPQGSYADGSMRVRQNNIAATVGATDINDYTKMGVVTETIYDFLGRPAITTLPGVTETGFWYKADYNQNMAGNKYSYFDFNFDMPVNGSCYSEAAPMDTRRGVSMYYSAANPDQGGAQARVADAGGYPFIQTVYEGDNASRPRMRSGAGYPFRTGSGHETQFVYGNPSQDDLNRLFGTDVGYASYYQKSMVIDANGQTSITYIDMSGRTIATSLAGFSPGSLEPLEDANGPLQDQGEERVEDQLEITADNPHGNQNLPTAGPAGYTSNRFLLVSSTQEYHIEYQMTGVDFQDACIPDFCADCIYDLEISLLDECGNYLVGNNTLDGPMKIRISGADINNDCDLQDNYGYSESVTLKPGVYNLVKKLSVAQDVTELYVNEMMERNECLLELSDFYEMPDISDCYIDCESCKKSLGSREDFITDNQAELGGADQAEMMYNSLMEQCASLCDEAYKDECSVGYEMMLQDMSPLGQYGMHNAGDPSAYPLSVFNLSNKLPKRSDVQFSNPFTAGNQPGAAVFAGLPSANWRNPRYRDPLSGTWFEGYYDDYGNRVKVVLNPDGAGGYLPQVHPSYTPQVDPLNGNLYIYPEQLRNTADFLGLWQASYARSLVVYHPEYFKYEFCSEAFNYTVHLHDDSGNVLSLNTYEYAYTLQKYTAAQAISELGISGPVSPSALINAMMASDPFFSATSSFAYGNVTGGFPGITARDIFLDKLSFQQVNPNVPFVLDIVQAAWVNTHCGLNAPLSCITSGIPATIDFSNPAIQPDKIWRQTAILYAAARQQAMAQAMDIFQAQQRSGIYTDCIGGSTYIFPPSTSWVSFAGVFANPCNVFDHALYASSEPRFPSLAYLLKKAGFNNPPSASELSAYAAQAGTALTGKCPMQIDFENMTGLLANNGLLVSGGLTDLSAGSYLGLTLDNYLQSVGNGYNADIIVSPSTIQIIIAGNCTTTLSWPASAPAGFGWSDVYFMADVHNTGGGLALYGYIQNSYPTSIEIPFSTCLNLTNCSPVTEALCKPTQDMQDIQALMNALSYNGQLWSATPVNLAAYTAQITVNLKTLLGVGPASGFSWQFFGGTSPRFDLSRGSVVLSISLDMVTSTLSIPPAAAQTLVNIYPSPVTTPSPGTFSNFSLGSVTTTSTMPHYIPPGTPELRLNGSLSIVNGLRAVYASECDLVPDPRCNTQEHQNLRNLESKLQTAIESGLMSQMMGTLSPCIRWPENYTNGSSIDPGDIVQVNAVSALMSMSQNGENSDYALIRVMLSGGTEATFIVESCDPFKNCDPCAEEDSCKRISATLNFRDYVNSYGEGSVPQTKYYITPAGDCVMFPPHMFTYTSAYASFYDFLHAWAAELNTLYGATYGIYATVQGYRIIIEKDMAFMPPGCVCDNYGLTMSVNEFVLESSANCCSMLNSGPGLRIAANRSEEEGWQTVVEPFSYDIDCYEPVTPFPTDSVQDPCISYLMELAAENAWNGYQAYLDSIRNALRMAYTARCMEALETFTLTYTSNEYHYTLYYYDLAGNLVRTVPPHAVKPISSADMTTINSARSAGTEYKPEHNSVAAGTDRNALSTRYRYNALNQNTATRTPDGGTTWSYFDNLGRLIVSKNARQAADVYTYSRYDALGRIYETGEMLRSDGVTATLSYLHTPLNANSFLQGGYTKGQFTRTYYDEAAGGLYYPAGFFTQENLRQRIAFVTHQPGSGFAVSNISFSNASYYSYDYHGNVKAILQDNKEMPDSDPSNLLYNFRFHKLEYRYDLQSGKVLELVLNRNRQDQLWQRYGYDDQNRLTRAQSSKDGYWFDTDAEYGYFYHGTTSRVEYGPYKNQGNDYTYTLQGWLKSVNSGQLDPVKDPGHDGMNATSQAFTGRDAYGLELFYFNGDYMAISGAQDQLLGVPAAYYGVPDLFNGNIRAMNNSLKLISNARTEALLQVFAYDQLNRIRGSHAYLQQLKPSDIQSWDPAAPLTDLYRTAYRYDPAGNILGLNRYDRSGTMFDALKYTYTAATNKLDYVDDPMSALYADYDIDAQAASNYSYDATGNLTGDLAEEIQNISWNLQGKVARVRRVSGSAKPDLFFSYDAMGNRISKRVVMPSGEKWTDYYVLDAAGNTLAIYRGEDLNAEDIPRELRLEENALYGTERLGTWARRQQLQFTPQATGTQELTRGFKRYEMKDHLGNVHAVLTDRKELHCDGNAAPEYYTAEVTNLYDYYPFGMLMPERTGTATHCDTLKNAVQAVLYDTDFNGPAESWGFMDPGHTWYFYGSDPARTDGSRFLLKHYNYPFTVSSAYAIMENGPAFPALPPNTTYYYEFDIDLGNCALDSLQFGVDDLNGSTMSYLDNITASGHYTGSFTSGAADEYVLAFALYGTDTCTAYLDNFRLWTYTDSLVCADSIGAGYYRYRYGFNGLERDMEMNETENTYTAAFWEYDARVGRRWNVDPAFREKPWLSPYHAFSNKPVLNVDPNGANDDEYNAVYNEKTKTYDKTKISDEYGKDVSLVHYKGGALDGQHMVFAKGQAEWFQSAYKPHPLPKVSDMAENNYEIPGALRYIRPSLESSISVYKGGGGINVGDLGVSVDIKRRDLGFAINSDDGLKAFFQSKKSHWAEKTLDGIKASQKTTTWNSSDIKSGFMVGIAFVSVGYTYTQSDPALKQPDQHSIKIGLFEFFSVDANFDKSGFKDGGAYFEPSVGLGAYFGIDLNAKIGIKTSNLGMPVIKP